MAGITHGRWSRCGLLLAALAVFAAHAGDDPPGAVARKVVKLEAGAQAFVADGDGFRHDGPAQGRLSLPAPVLGVSPRGYVQVQGNNGSLWLDELDVDIEPRHTAAKADCTLAVSSDASTRVAASRGAGEGCKR